MNLVETLLSTAQFYKTMHYKIFPFYIKQNQIPKKAFILALELFLIMMVICTLPLVTVEIGTLTLKTFRRDGGKVYRLMDNGEIPSRQSFCRCFKRKTSCLLLGHRNPQGMAKHPVTGEIWTHEHGPRGGDEINIIKAGKNYGWPKITYGKNYTGTTITKDKALPGMEQPLYYWIPSIAPSGMAFVHNSAYADWNGSLVVGSLKFNYLERLTL